MQAALVLLVIAASTAWLAVDASKRDWTGNSFAKNVPTWVIGSLLLWIVVFPLYVFAHRKKAALKAPAKPEPAPMPAVAMAASGPSEQYGPSIDEVELEEPQAEPVVEIEREAVVEVAPQPEPVVELGPEPDPVVELESEPEPVALSEPVVEVTPEPVVEVEPEPDPVVELEAHPVVEPEPVIEPAVETEPVVETEPEPVLEISYPDLPVDEAPPGLSVDAFKDIKPVSFGGVVVEEDEPVQPDPEPAPPTVEPEAVEPEPIPEPEPTPEFEPMPIVEPLSYPLEDEPVMAEEPEPSFAAVMADTDVGPEREVAAEPEPEPEPEAKKRGFRIPNPRLKLPSFGRKRSPSTGMKLPQITLPPNLQGPLTDLERKIALGSVVAIVAAAAFGYSTAPSDEAASPTPTTAPAAVER